MRRTAVGLLLALALAASLALAGNARAGNSINSQSCQQDGWQLLFRPDLSAFSNDGDCVSYGAAGGTYIQSNITITPTLFSADDPICYGIGFTEVCRGFIVTGQALDPNSTVTVSLTGDLGPISQTMPVNADGTYWVAWRFSCHAEVFVSATGTSLLGVPLSVGPQTILPVC
jgi:hypothetical protein